MTPDKKLTLLRDACAIALKNDVTGSLVRQSILAADQEDYNTAIELAQQAADCCSCYTEPTVILATLLQQKPAHRDKAVQYFEQVVGNDVNNTLALWYLGCEKMRSGQAQAALPLLTAAAHVQPADTYLIMTLVWLYLQMGNISAAISYIKNVLRKPDSELICPALARLITCEPLAQQSGSSANEDTILQCLLDLHRLCNSEAKYDQVLPAITASGCDKSPSLQDLRKQTVCHHLINPALRNFQNRFGKKVVENYSNDFFELFLIPDIRAGFRRNNLRANHNKAGTGNIPQEMVLVPGGKYTIGCNEPKFNYPERKCAVSAFMIDRYPVTNQQWRQQHPHYTFHRGHENHPVVNVDFIQAMMYARSIGKRLPTEIEWEAAARGFEGRPYPWGMTADIQRVNCAEKRARSSTSVTQHPQGAAPCGAVDMLGNVFEWVDGLGSPNNTQRNRRLAKGGYWPMRIKDLKNWTRAFYIPDSKLAYVGFRCAKDI